jgi:hypothetical protein
MSPKSIRRGWKEYRLNLNEAERGLSSTRSAEFLELAENDLAGVVGGDCSYTLDGFCMDGDPPGTPGDPDVCKPEEPYWYCDGNGYLWYIRKLGQGFGCSEEWLPFGGCDPDHAPGTIKR